MARTFKLKPWVYAGLLALSPLFADAAGLGKLTVTSALGQPLRAEIELVAVQNEELNTIMARLASEDAFKEASIERTGVLMSINFSVAQKKDGASVLKLSTVQPVNEPFLDMLIELNWAAGRLLREYTVLLDPPGYAEPQSAQPVIVSSVKSAQTESPEQGPIPVSSTAPSTATSGDAEKAGRKAKSPKPVEEAKASPVQQDSEGKNYGPVQKGETLFGIASQLKADGYNLEQMLVALYQANKKAFAGNNMNRLKAGQILRVPDEQQLAAIDRAEASREFKAHTANWNAYRQKLAAAVSEAPAPQEAVPKQEAKGKITSAVEDKAASPTPSKDVLKVSKGEAPANAKEMQALQGRVQSLQEETIAREKSLKEANSRIETLEKNINEMQQLIELKNKNLADLQKQSAARPEPAVPAKPAAPEAAKPVESEAAPVEPPKPAAEPVKPKPVPVKPVHVETPPEAPSLLETVTGNPLYLAGGAGALVLLGGGALLAINRRRRKSLSSFEDSILTGGDLKANTVFGETAGGVVDTGDTSFLTDFSQAGLGAIDTNDVDPIAEAEVYMAYGRDAQAEEILKEAMAKDPNRHEIHLKLLEIYASRKNLIAFETLAGELYAAIGGQVSPIWEKVAEMGRALDPNNPLYSRQEGGKAMAPMQGVDLTEPTQGLVEEEPKAEVQEEEATPDLDFSVDETSVEAEAEAPVAEAPVAEVAPAEEIATVASAEDDFGALEFDLGNFSELAAEAPASEETAPESVEAQGIASPPSDVEPSMEFDLGELMPPQVEAEPEAVASSEPVDEAMTEAPLDEVTQPGGMELDLDALLSPSDEETTAAVAEPAPADEGFDLDFALDFPESAPETSAEPETVAAQDLPMQEEESIVIESTPAEEEAHLDFNFDLGTEEKTVAPEAKEPSAMAELDLSNIDLNLDEPFAQTSSSSEEMTASTEAATKLDLARAYVEMGDVDGAREILEEVLKEGNSQQQADANQLLESL